MARLFLASIGRQWSLGESVVADLRTAVGAVIEGVEGRQLEFTADRTSDGATVTLSPITAPELEPGDDSIRDLLDGLFFEVECSDGLLAIVAVDDGEGH